MRRDRCLYVDLQPRLGERLDDDTFEVNADWWEHCGIVCPSVDDASVVTSEDATLLADLLDVTLHAVGIDIHLKAWGDDGTATQAFLNFLRGGGFSVCNLTELQSQS